MNFNIPELFIRKDKHIFDALSIINEKKCK